MSDDPATTCTPLPPPTADGSPRSFDPAWRTETVSALAKGVEAERAFDRLPILADALEEAGCDDGLLLRHCRECARHTADCWVLRQVLHPVGEQVLPGRSEFGGLPRYEVPSHPLLLSSRKFGPSLGEWVLISGLTFTSVLFGVTLLTGWMWSPTSPPTKPHRVSGK